MNSKNSVAMWAKTSFSMSKCKLNWRCRSSSSIRKAMCHLQWRGSSANHQVPLSFQTLRTNGAQQPLNLILRSWMSALLSTRKTTQLVKKSICIRKSVGSLKDHWITLGHRAFMRWTSLAGTKVNWCLRTINNIVQMERQMTTVTSSPPRTKTRCKSNWWVLSRVRWVFKPPCSRSTERCPFKRVGSSNGSQWSNLKSNWIWWNSCSNTPSKLNSQVKRATSHYSRR